MSDETLLSQDITDAAADGLLEPFNPNHLAGASYNFSAGRTIVILGTESEGHTPIDLQVKGTWEIPPGRAAILYSLEKIHMPTNMKGRLSSRSRLATRLLLFPGGPIDPGYQGYLFFPLANLSDAPIAITYGEEIVSGEFVRLIKHAEPYNTEELDSIPPERLPTPSKQPVYDLQQLTAFVSEMQAKVSDLSRMQPEVAATKRVVDGVVLGAIAGLGAGVGGAGIILGVTELSAPWNGLVAGLAIGIGIVTFIVQLWFRKD